jgi:hypothetical protein
MVVVVALAFGVNFWKSSRAKLNASAPGAVAERQLNYWILVQKYKDDKPYKDPFILSDEINLEPDYHIRLQVRSPQAGYLYVLNEGPTKDHGAPEFVILFPSPTANNGATLVGANSEIQIPQASWFTFDEEQGAEKLWLVWSANAIPELDAVRGYAIEKSKGAIDNPDSNRAVEDFLTKHSASKPIVEKSTDRKQTTVRARGDLLVQLVQLEHH